MGEIVKVENNSIFLQESTVNLAHEDRSDKDSQIIKPKEKFVSNFPRSTFFKQSIAFAKSSLPKVLKFHESKKSNKNSFNQSFPFLFLGLLIIVIIIALLTRNRKRQPLPEPNPDESNCLMIICQNLKIFFLF